MDSPPGATDPIALGLDAAAVVASRELAASLPAFLAIQLRIVDAFRDT